MKIVRNENGYSLLLTLMIVLLFSILGMALISMTFNGITRNETRENTVQSIDLATKGEQYLIADINSRIAQFVKNENVLTNEVFHQEFLSMLNDYDCQAKPSYLKALNEDIKKDTSTGDSIICVDTKSVAPYDETLTKFKVPLISIGTAGSKDSVVRSTYLMGAQDVKESLKYSVSTFKNESGQGGNLILHGGAELQGNINVENNLFSTSYSYGLGKWLNSTLPRAENSKLFLGNKIYTLANNTSYNAKSQSITGLTYSGHVNSDFSTDLYTEIEPTYFNPSSPKNVVGNGFASGYTPALYKNEEENIYYNVSEGFEGLNSYRFSNKNTSHSLEYNCRTEWRWIVIPVRVCDNWKYTLLSGSKTEAAPIKYNGDVYITGNGSNIHFNDAVHIRGDLIIGNMNYDHNDSNTYHNISLNGKTIYVEGKVRVQGVNLKANANLYVKGNETNSYLRFFEGETVRTGWWSTEVRDNDVTKLTTRFYELTMSGFTNTNNPGSMIVFSKGKLQIANISEYLPNPSELTGYFYSEGPMELYGFGSNLKIIGGVSANSLTLNAMRGESGSTLSTNKGSKCGNKENHQFIGTSCFELKEKQENELSRLTIEYNEQILETYSNNQQGLFSNITEDDVIDKVQLLDRDFE